jgi:hypothetical protein
MKFLKRLDNILQHKKIPSVALRPGDSVYLSYTDVDGKIHPVMNETVSESYVFDEALVFKVDDTDYRGLGGAFLEKK